MVEEKKTRYSGIKEFGVWVRMVDVLPDDPENIFEDHIHSECEIYVNLTGDVSFMVENRIYPVKSGSVIITRPCEYHHCIYHGNEPHKHLWMLFDSNGNEELFPLFFKRELGQHNLINLSEKQKSRVTELFSDMIRKEKSSVDELTDFLKLMSILENADIDDRDDYESVPLDIAPALEYIGENLGSTFSVPDVAKASHISVNTLERRFLEVLKMTPSGYIKSRRLARAAELLPSCASVGEVCERCGFQDYSNFIALFRKQFGLTPLKYKKLHEKKASEPMEVTK